MQRDSRSMDAMYVGKLLDAYEYLRLETWAIQLIPQALSEDSITVSTKVVYLEKEGDRNREYTLAGFLSPEETFRHLHEVRSYLFEDPRFRDSLKELHTVVPEGVTEIDLSTIFGDDVQYIEDAWMLNANICAILQRLKFDEGYDNEIIVLDMKNRSVISRTQIPRISSPDRQGWEDGVFYMSFILRQEPRIYWKDMTDWSQYNNYAYIKASISPEGKVELSDIMQKCYTVMPDGKAAVYTADDGSLYAIDLVTREEELLIQGIPKVLVWPESSLYVDSLDVMPTYVPFWDELPSDDWDEIKDGSFPFIADDLEMTIREFDVVEPLDEFRFVYKVNGREWGNGFGIYDLQTRTDHRITGRGMFIGMRQDTLFGASLKADANTYKSSPLPKSVQEQFTRIAWILGLKHYDISPDARLVAMARPMSNLKGADYGIPVTLTNIQNGDIIKNYNIGNSYATEQTLNFYDNTHFMLFCKSEKHGSAFIYLFDVEV